MRHARGISGSSAWPFAVRTCARRLLTGVKVNCTYLRPAPLGSTVFVESWVVNLGKRMGLIMGTMRLGSMDGKICYTCEHGKVSLDRASL